MLEVHVTLSREMFGPDVPVSLTTEELRQLVDGVRFIERMRAHPVDKDACAAELAADARALHEERRRPRALPAGTVLREEHLAAKKPGHGNPGGAAARAHRGAASGGIWPADELRPAPTIWRSPS